MESVKITLELLRLISWPIVTILALIVFHKQIRSVLEGIRPLLDRIKKADAFGISVELAEQLVNEAKPSPQVEASLSDIELSVSTGAYSTDYRAIFLVVGLSNRTEQSDQVITWQLSFPSLGIQLGPTAAPQNLGGGVPWLASPMVKLPANELVQGSLFFKGKGAIAEAIPEEPLRGRVDAETLHGKKLSQDVEIYRLTTLQAKATAASA
jgi:hypothetical protein